MWSRILDIPRDQVQEILAQGMNKYRPRRYVHAISTTWRGNNESEDTYPNPTAEINVPRNANVRIVPELRKKFSCDTNMLACVGQDYQRDQNADASLDQRETANYHVPA